jgi:predicted nucleic-acid-binding Zn-ribbon protein
MKTNHLLNFKFHCPKCGNDEYVLDKFLAAGSLWFANVLNKKFTTVSCTRCFFTEVYKIPFKKFKEIAGIYDKTTKY